MRESYQHGGAVFPQGGVQRSDILDFSVNINPRGMPPEVEKALHRAVSACIHYPDPFARGLVAGLAAQYGVRETQVFCGNGAADVIERLAEVLQPRRALLLAPTFSEYERALVRRGCHCAFHVLRAEEGFQLTERIFDDLTPDTELFWLCLPNNPTGLLPSRELFARIVVRCAELDILLLTDECFLGFVAVQNPPSLRCFLQNASGARRILLSAFTKTFAMPGVRLGYCISSEEMLCGQLFQAGQPWAVSVLAEAAGEAALRCTGWVAESAELLSAWREELRRKLRVLGFWVAESQANFLFFAEQRPDTERAERLLRHCASRGVPIRDCSNFRGLSAGYFRAAVRTTEENQKLVAALREFLEEGG